jgi:hypothetical protein
MIATTTLSALITYALVWRSVGYNGKGYDFKKRSYVSYKERNCR